MSGADSSEGPENSGPTSSDEELIQIDSDVVDVSTDVAPLELETETASPASAISLEDPPLPECDIATTSSPSRLSSRSRSRSSRRRTHRLRQPRWRSRFQIKKKESNFVAAACSMIVIVLMCTAMAEPNWFYLKGGGCRTKTHETPVHYLGINQFFYMGHFVWESRPGEFPYYVYGPNPEEGLMECVNETSVKIIRGMIALCSMGVVFTILAFLLDLHGPSVRILKNIQRHAVLSMLTVAICVTVTGFCYWTTQIIQVLQVKTKPHTGSKVEVQFSIGFYLIAAAGSMAVVAAGCNLLRRPAPIQDDDRDRLMQDIDAAYNQDPYGPMDFMMPPPPPPYQP